MGGKQSKVYSDSSKVLSVALDPTSGFHTTLSTRLLLNQTAYADACSLHVLHKFPPNVIVDSNELKDRGFVFELQGPTDLELPVVAVEQTDVWLLLNLNASSTFKGISETGENDDGGAREITVNVPLHMRYSEPTMGGPSHDEVPIEPPRAFWACAADPSLSHLPESLPDIPAELHSTFVLESPRFNLIPPADGVKLQPMTMRVPAGDLTHLPLVQIGTAAVVFLAAGWLAKRIYVASQALRATHEKKEE